MEQINIQFENLTIGKMFMCGFLKTLQTYQQNAIGIDFSINKTSNGNIFVKLANDIYFKSFVFTENNAAIQLCKLENEMFKNHFL